MWTVDQIKRQDGQPKHDRQGGLINDKRAAWVTLWVITRVMWPFSQIQQNRRADNTHWASLPPYLQLEIELGRNEYFPSTSGISTVISADKWPAGPKDPHPRLLQREALRVHAAPRSHVSFWLRRRGPRIIGEWWGRISSKRTGHMHNSCKRARQGWGWGVWGPLMFDEREEKYLRKTHFWRLQRQHFGSLLILSRFHVVQHRNRLSLNPWNPSNFIRKQTGNRRRRKQRHCLFYIFIFFPREEVW